MPARPGTLMLFRRRSSESMAGALGASSPGQAEVGVAEAAARERRAAGADRLDDLARVAPLERADVASVDRRHRRHVARAEAFERAYLRVLERLLLGLVLDRLEHAPRLLRHARDARADVHVAAADGLLVVHVVEACDHREVGRRDP